MSTRQSDTPDSSNPYSYSKMQLKRYCKAALKITTYKSFAAANSFSDMCFSARLAGLCDLCARVCKSVKNLPKRLDY